VCASTKPVAAYRSIGADARFAAEIVSALVEGQREIRALAAALKA
jgi:hypothetical protein